MKKTILILGIIFLLIISAINPLVISNNIKTLDNMESETLSDGPMDSQWSMYCHDTRHTGRSEYSTANNPFEEKWWFKTTHEREYYEDYCFINIAGDGTIYFTDVDGYIYTLYPNGTLKWKFDVFDWILCHPAIDNNGTIYFGTEYGYFFALNPNGTVKWTYPFPPGLYIYSSPAIAEDGTIYFGTSHDGYIYAFYANGTIKWKYKLISDATYSSPAIANDGTIYIADHDGYLYAIYPNGLLRWKVRLCYHLPSGPSVADDGTIYIATYNVAEKEEGYLFAIDPNNGAGKWKYKIGSDYYVNPSLGEDRTIYVLGKIVKHGFPSSVTTTLYAINPDGTEKWAHKVSGSTVKYSDPAISADGTIYVAAGGNLYAFNPDGTQKWCKKFDIPYLEIESSPVIGEDGTIYLSLCHYKKLDDYGWQYILTSYLHAFNKRNQNAPSAPEITGPTQVKPGKCNNYTIVSTDPNEDDIYYHISWGEPSYQIPSGPYIDSELIEMGPFSSGEEITMNYTWYNYWISRDSYTIKVIAKDTNNLVSPWSTLKVRMSRDKAIIGSPLLRFLERYPLLQTLLMRLGLQ